MHRWFVSAVLFAYSLTLIADAQEGPKNSVILIIRHAEDGASDRGLTQLGKQRAEAYKDYFKNFAVDSKGLEPDVIFAAKDSKQSHRPRLTVEPFAKGAKLKTDTRFGNNQSIELVADLRENKQGKRILICWRHPYIPDLLRALGVAPETLLPNGKWPKDVFDWVIMVSFDENGHVIPGSTKRITEHLLPGDSQ